MATHIFSPPPFSNFLLYFTFIFFIFFVSQESFSVFPLQNSHLHTFPPWWNGECEQWLHPCVSPRVWSPLQNSPFDFWITFLFPLSCHILRSRYSTFFFDFLTFPFCLTHVSSYKTRWSSVLSSFLTARFLIFQLVFVFPFVTAFMGHVCHDIALTGFSPFPLAARPCH